MPRYVILRHECPPDSGRPSHWDLMLEWNGHLRTWALEHRPRVEKAVRGVALPDHRLDYLTYEGPLTGNRGSVRRWDEGEYVLLDDSDDELLIKLAGKMLTGELAIRHDAKDPQCWRFALAAG